MIGDNSDLDQRLGDLFADRNHALAPLPGATGLVLARVRRARRRRQAIRTAVPVLAAVLVGAVMLGGLGSRLHAAPATPAHQGTSTPAPVLDPVQLRMSGSSVGPLRLGMTRAQAEATGLLGTPYSPAPGCWKADGHRGITAVRIGPNGVYRIEVDIFTRTEQDAGGGDTYAQVRQRFPAALPAVPSSRTDYRVPVPGQPGVWYVFTFQGPSDGVGPVRQNSRVIALRLQNDDRSCG